MILTKEFWKAAIIRAIYTIASTALAVITVSGGTMLSQVNWLVVLQTSLLSGVISILKSVIVGIPEANREELK